jgi:hypothetical protein
MWMSGDARKTYLLSCLYVAGVVQTRARAGGDGGRSTGGGKAEGAGSVNPLHKDEEDRTPHEKIEMATKRFEAADQDKP